MKSYSIRSAEGKLIATITGQRANNILQKASGFWREYKLEGEKATRCFELTENGTYAMSGGELTIYLWEGTLVIED